jgi:hypothetical protein
VQRPNIKGDPEAMDNKKAVEVSAESMLEKLF